MAELNAKQTMEDDTMQLNVKVKRLINEAVIPKYAHEGDAGVDLVAVEDIIIEPGDTKLIPTGIAISLPPGFEAQVRPRSGITLKTKIRIQLGTIDQGYTGEIGVIADNIAQRTHRTGNEVKKIDGSAHHLHSLSRYLDENTYIVRKGDRIAQLVFAPIENAFINEVKTIDATQRGSGAFGSTGVTNSEAKEVSEMPNVQNLTAEVSELIYNAKEGK